MQSPVAQLTSLRVTGRPHGRRRARAASAALVLEVEEIAAVVATMAQGPRTRQALENAERSGG